VGCCLITAPENEYIYRNIIPNKDIRMAIIKSALEIALERSKDVEADREALEANQFVTEGKKLVSRFFADAEADEQPNLKAGIEKFDKKQQQWVREGVLQALLANLKLPADEMSMLQSKRAAKGFAALASDTRQLSRLLNQVEQFLGDYLEERKRLVGAVEQRYAPMLRQKEQEMSRQMGQPVKIDPMMDPGFQKMLRENLAMLEDRYGEVLGQARQELRRLCQ